MTSQLRGLMGMFCAILAIMMLMYIYSTPSPWEGFVDSRGRCGPNIGVCPDGLRCMNGYCKTDIAPTLPILSDLPVHPDRYPYEADPPAHNIVGVCDTGL